MRQPRPVPLELKRGRVEIRLRGALSLSRVASYQSSECVWAMEWAGRGRPTRILVKRLDTDTPEERTEGFISGSPLVPRGLCAVGRGGLNAIAVVGADAATATRAFDSPVSAYAASDATVIVGTTAGDLMALDWRLRELWRVQAFASPIEEVFASDAVVVAQSLRQLAIIDQREPRPPRTLIEAAQSPGWRSLEARGWTRKSSAPWGNRQRFFGVAICGAEVLIADHDGLHRHRGDGRRVGTVDPDLPEEKRLSSLRAIHGGEGELAGLTAGRVQRVLDEDGRLLPHEKRLTRTAHDRVHVLDRELRIITTRKPRQNNEIEIIRQPQGRKEAVLSSAALGSLSIRVLESGAFRVVSRGDIYDVGIAK